jgi:hypothetical protein
MRISCTGVSAASAAHPSSPPPKGHSGCPASASLSSQAPAAAPPPLTSTCKAELERLPEPPPSASACARAWATPHKTKDDLCLPPRTVRDASLPLATTSICSARMRALMRVTCQGEERDIQAGMRAPQPDVGQEPGPPKRDARVHRALAARALIQLRLIMRTSSGSVGMPELAHLYALHLSPRATGGGGGEGGG